MRIIPKHVLRHAGQRAAQHARWAARSADGWAIQSRVTRNQWAAATAAGLKVHHVILPDGQVLVLRFTAHWG